MTNSTSKSLNFFIFFEKIRSFSFESTESKPTLNFALTFDDKRVKILLSLKKFINPDGVLFRKVIKTGERSYCSMMEWADEQSLANARQKMIAYLDTIRDLLEEISPELGVTDPVSGPVVIDEQGNVTTPGGTISGKIKT